MAGVVNFIRKDDFEGLEFDGQFGVTEEGDGEETSISGLMGADFADGRGNVMIGADYAEKSHLRPGPRLGRRGLGGSRHDGRRHRQLQLTSSWVDPSPSAGENVIGVDSHDQADLFANWSFGERYSLRAGIDNLFNADPEVVGATPTDNNLGSTNTNYDPFGRRFFIGLSVDM